MRNIATDAFRDNKIIMEAEALTSHHLERRTLIDPAEMTPVLLGEKTFAQVLADRRE